MRQIKLVMDKPFHNSVDITILDITEEKEKKRGKITADYSELDVKPLIKQGMNLEAVIEDYNQWIDRTLRRYLLDDCNVVSGRTELLDVIRKRISEYFE